ncbi:carboxypeptidase-like regulatory domain-containing protein [Flavobacterium hercynium]|uniref:TonB-dependent receptor n=1 Tax=Flavobacterium hercynium TaxID=387094 RepID=A0A226H0D3_9FLAO|nr:carboxypeptidase-like regulatory domain-containing protein [Flavobacterium hercynium]OXA87645.1 hypothetical protein B0A66_16040 [Flavobacterium hercynium]SMP11047.1 CarboxypepD_reg-like domain-containing protein [Flavobacterium hercynium]
MAQKIKISIPEPCHENWQKMTVTEKGRFCSSCKKNVTDFTRASDREILLAYNKDENLCGRFNVSQLNRKISVPKEKETLWMIAAASVIAFLGLGNQTVKAQNNVNTEQTDISESNDLIVPKIPEPINYSGTVIDQYGMPLPGASINIKGTKIGTQTDFDGQFYIKAQEGLKIVLTYIGYKKQEVFLTKNAKMSFKMTEDIQELQVFVLIAPDED